MVKVLTSRSDLARIETRFLKPVRHVGRSDFVPNRAQGRAGCKLQLQNVEGGFNMTSAAMMCG